MILKFFKKILKGIRKIKKNARPRRAQRPKKLEVAQSPSQQLSLTEDQAPKRPQIAVSNAIQEFALVQLSPHSRRAYTRDLRDFFEFLRMNNIWSNWNNELSPLLVAEYREHLSVKKSLAKSSVTRKLAVLKSFCKWALIQGWIEKNPADLVKTYPQTQDSKTGFLSDGEIAKLLQSFPPINNSRLYRALSRVTVETLLMLGLRRSEAASIHMKDLERLEERWVLRVHGKGSRERILPIPERLLDTWSEWLQRLYPDSSPPQNLIDAPSIWAQWLKQYAGQPLLVSSRAKSFDTPLSTAEIGRIVRKSARFAGLVQRVSPHALRASAITHALDQGASHRGVQQMAGWTSPLMITRYDKRRKDPRFSAIHDLRYALRESSHGSECKNEGRSSF